MAIVEWREQALLFSTDPGLLDIDLIHRFLSEESYWVPGIARELVETGIANSLCFGVYVDTAQIAFARVVTDYVGVGYLADVFVITARRGQGVSKRLISSSSRTRSCNGCGVSCWRRAMRTACTRNSVSRHSPHRIGSWSASTRMLCCAAR